MVYNLIREFTRNFHCRFIVTGSYLGRTLNTEFKLSAGDLKSLRIETLDFEEFTEAFGLHEEYEGMGLYGTQHPEELARLSELFGLYLEIGGYPAVVTEYLETESTEKSREKLVVHDYDSNISKSVCNRAIMWLQSAGILDFAGKISECRVMDFKGRCRCYFTDLGLAYYFFRKIGASSSDMQGMLHENFVFLELRRRAERL